MSRERVARLNQIARSRYEQVLIDEKQAGPSATPAGNAESRNVPENPETSAEPEKRPPSPRGPEIVGMEHYDVQPPSYWRSRLEGMKANVKAERSRRAEDHGTD